MTTTFLIIIFLYVILKLTPANISFIVNNTLIMSSHIDISIKGKKTKVTASFLHGLTLISKGNFIKYAEIFDEYWLEKLSLPFANDLIEELIKSQDKPDIFTFTQRVPDNKIYHKFLYELDNYAVLPISTYENWFQRQIHSTTKRNIKASEKRGIKVRVSEYSDDYINGIKSIYDESPIRAGRKYWHYGKDFDTVKKENGTYAERSTYLAAYLQGEMVGYLKIVWDKETAAIMQILSKLSVREYRPNNALLAEAVKQCCIREVKYLLYERYDYGNKTGDSLTRFKQNNGFIRMDIPKYFVPLTIKGKWALRLGLHKSLIEILPEWIASPIRGLRTKWYSYKINSRP